MATWPAVSVGHPGSGGTAVLIPDVSGPHEPSDQSLAFGASAWPDRDDRRAVRPAHRAHDPRVQDPPSGPPPIRPELDLMRRDEAGVAICDVLAAWRAAERELAGLVAGDRRANLVEAEVCGLRDLHQRLFAARARPSSSSLGDRNAALSAIIGPSRSRSARQLTR